MIFDANTQTDGEISAKIKQLMENGCTTIVLTNPKVITAEESETIYQIDIVGIKPDEE